MRRLLKILEVLASPEPKGYFACSAFFFVGSGVVGLYGALLLALPEAVAALAPFVVARPVHVMLSLLAVIFGMIGLVNAQTEGAMNSAMNKRVVWQGRAFRLFALTGLLSLLFGYGSGREYFSWSPVASLFLFWGLYLSLSRIVRARKRLEKESPEGLWLWGTGALLLCLSLVESLFWLVPFVGDNSVRDLMVQWHSIDAFFAGMNVTLYGAALFLFDVKPRPARRRSLYLIAAFSLLFTFAHHHYISAQPFTFKMLALIASMLGIMSLYRHSLAYWKHARNRAIQEIGIQKRIIRSVEIWTLMSLLSGVAFAVPQINLYVHGTYMIVIHAMGSFIGVSLIIFAGGFRYLGALSDKRERRACIALRFVNVSLLGLWLVLGYLGIAKGLMRADTDYLVFSMKLAPLYVLFPVCGFGLLAGLSGLARELFACSLRDKA